MNTPVPRLSFSHMGMHVTDVARMEDFYTRVLGFTVTDRGELETPRGRIALVFLSRDPSEHHQIVLASGRPADAGFNPINQISFRVDDLGALREMHARVTKEGVQQLYPVSHGNALSVYFHDPEGNRVELFIDTPWYVKQPLRIPLDMGLSDADLWAHVEAEARKLPGFQPVEQWSADLGRKMQRNAG
jgi:catechol 2,3-dioxygenase-like lactoylglutathione lyase family enzyme